MFENNLTEQFLSESQAYFLKKSRLSNTRVIKQKQTDVDFRQIEQLIETLYDIPLSGASWIEWLTQLRQILKADRVYLGTGARSDSEGFLSADNEDCSEIRHAVLAGEFSGLPVNEIHDIEDIKGKSWMQSTTYLEIVKPLNIRYILGIDLSNESGITFPLRVLRSARQGAFTKQDKDLCHHLIPHLQRTIKILTRQDHNKSKHQICKDMLHHAGLGMIFFSADGFISEINALAQKFLSENGDMSLSQNGRHLHFYDKAKEDEMSKIVKAAIAMSAQGSVVGPVDIISLKQKDSDGYIYASVWSLSQGRSARSAVAFIQASNSPLPKYVQEMARKMFGLSPKQAKVAMRLIEGHSINQTAEIEGNSVNTMRSHRDDILLKTDVNRQSRLMRLLSRALLLA